MENMGSMNPRQSLMNKLSQVSQQPMQAEEAQSGGFPKTFNSFQEFADYAKSFFDREKEEVEPTEEMNSEMEGMV